MIIKSFNVIFFLVVFCFVFDVETKFEIPSDAPTQFKFAASRFIDNEYRSDFEDFPLGDREMPTRGFIYSGIGGRSLREACVSALSLLEIFPNANITLVTNTQGQQWAREHPHVSKVFRLIINSEVKSNDLVSRAFVCKIRVAYKQRR
jgi:hypothetical protein